MSSESKDAQTVSVILEYLTKQNRPYSATDIHSNLHNQLGKTAVVKALEELVSNGTIKSKAYNKQVVYVADQSVLADVDGDELKEMDSKISQLTEENNILNGKYKELEKVFNDLKSTFIIEEAKIKVKQVESEIKILSGKLDTLKNNSNAVSLEEGKEVLAMHNKQLKELRKRKRIVKEMVGAVLEGYLYPKKAS